MRSQLAVRLGSMEPEILHLPPDVHSLAAAEEAIELANAYGVCDGYPLAENQELTLKAAMGERADGTWAASRVGDFGPRQGTGKNDKITARELYGLLVRLEKLIIHTAHEFPTANEAFLRMAALFENWDDLSRQVEHIYYANGAQAIHLKGGRRLLYKTRTGSAGRGFAKADLVVYDESQHLNREQVAASGPAKLANPNSQTWYAGSGGLSTSKVAWAMRRAALLGTAGRLAYTEKTAERIRVEHGKILTAPPDDITDRDAWYKAMPGLGRWVTEEAMEGLYDELGPELFAREALCVWDPEPDDTGEQVIPAEDWLACKSDTPRSERVAYAVDASPDGKSAAIAASDGLVGKVLEHHPGTSWVWETLAKHLGERKGPVFLDPKSPAGAILEDKPADVEVTEVSPQQHAQACGGLLNAVTFEGEQRKFAHTGQQALDAAVKGATRRVYGDAWAWSRRSSNVDISPLVAVTLARWGALTMTDDSSAYEDRGLVVL